MAIYEALKDDYMRVPSTPEEWTKIAYGFAKNWNFPNCIGALDEKHVVMKKQHHSDSTLNNYKRQESIVLMAAVDAERR